MEINKLEELNWIYHTLANRPGIYLLASIVDRAKDYSVADVHNWAAEDNLGSIYEKIKDLILVRIHEAVKVGDLDKVMAESIIKTYYHKPYTDLVEREGIEENLDADDIILEKLEKIIRICSV